jgi:ribosomal protein S7
MKKIKFLKKNQNSSLNFFLVSIKKSLFYYTNSFKKTKKIFINHNQIISSSLFFDILIFYRKIKKTKLLFRKFLENKKTKKTIYATAFLKIQKFKQYISFDLYTKFISFIFKTGKNFFWETAFSLIFNNLSLKFSYTRSFILSKIFIRLFTRVELKKVKSRKRISYIPFFISVKRSLFLALKWIFLSAISNNTKISFQNKLYIELIQLLTLKSCLSLKKLEENNSNSFNNRSNVHYRWDR